MLEKFFPFLTWLPLAKKSWKDDLIAGITGTIIVIPQAVAFAMIAGLPPVYGFYTAMITPVIAALFGSSYHLISGPTTAISIVVFATISQHVDPASDIEQYVALTLVLTFMAGLIQFAMGLAKMGKLVNFVSHSVILGFTAGAGVLIAFKQLKHVFGLPVPQGSSFYAIIKYIGNHIHETNWYVFGVAIGTLVIALIIRKIKPLSRYYMLIAMVLGSILAVVLGGEANGIKTVGKIPSNLPPFSIPELSLYNIRSLSGGAITLAVLGLIEAVAIARSIAMASHQRIDGNQEFIGQGLSNMIASFFSSYMGSGSFTRSGVNYQAGAKTPLSAIFAAVFLALVLLLFSDYAAYLPKPAMGGIILLVGYNLIDFHHIRQVFKSSRREITVLGTTLFGTLFFELETALFVGVSLSLFFYLERTAKPNIAILGTSKESNKFINIIRDSNVKECPQLKIVRIDGSIYFGALEVVADFFNTLYDEGKIKHVLVVAKGVNFIDLAGSTWLAHETLKWQKRGGGIYFSGLKIISQGTLKKGGYRDEIGLENFYPDKKTAIKEIYKKLDKNICATCEVRVFKECNS